MDIIRSVFDIAEKFMENPEHVLIDKSMLMSLAHVMEEEGITKFPNELNVEEINLEDEVKLELLASSINYCYWYGKSDIRPNNASSSLMYELLEQVYENCPKILFNEKNVDRIFTFNFAKSLSVNRFPLIEERIKHLMETTFVFDRMAVDIIEEDGKDAKFIVSLIVEGLPGFASDIFLKRASLFCMQLNRKFGWYKDTINELPVPADYQVPKMLEFYGGIIYSEKLSRLIMNEELIPKGSLMECEIRAATIIACKTISDWIGWTSQEIDSWLWLRRKECDRPFHLTITTDY